jgi:hypothetical protein
MGSNTAGKTEMSAEKGGRDAKQRLVQFEVRPGHKGGGWDIAQGRRVVAHVDTKVEAVRRGAAVARQQPASSRRIRKQNGQIEEERTYPRSADPRRSKG